jgi:hypothetical protein
VRTRFKGGIKHGRWLAAALGIVSLLLGAALVQKAGGSTSGSPLGWVLVALGIISLLIAFGIVVGAYGQ